MDASGDKTTRSRLAKLAVGSSNISVELVEGLYGTMSTDRAIIFQDPDGGFTCGSTGKPPLPVPWPPNPFSDPSDLIKAGVLDADVLNLIRESKAAGKDLTRVFEEPTAAARELGLSLSSKSAEDLHQLAPSNISKVKDRVDKEMLTLFHEVIKDGRYTETWFTGPNEVAQELKVKISDVAIERILTVATQARFGGGSIVSVSAIAAGVIWAGVCIAVGTLFVGQMNPIDTLVKDRSGKAKF